MVTGALSESRKAVGCFAFLPTGDGEVGLIMNGRSSRNGRNRNMFVVLKKLLSPSVYAAHHLGVIRVLAGRMISCHPQWWPSTA